MQVAIDSVFSQFDSPEIPGCSVSVLLNGELIHSAGYGSAQLEYQIPITPSTIFHVASVSKQFTCFAMLLLAERGMLTLDDDTRTHIPELNDFGHIITIRHLCHHTSGLRDQWTLLNIAGWRPDDVVTKEHILKLLYRQEELNFLPGEEHLYCNSGYSLLAKIVERVTGGPFRSFLQSEIFDPLGMTATHVHDDHQKIVPNRAYSYTPKEESGFENSILSFANHGATSLFTTVEDLARWMNNYESKRVGSALIRQLLETGCLNSGEKIDYAFGLTVSPYRGRKQIQHSGSDAGFRSHILMIPECRFGVVVLSNVSNSNPGGLARQIAAIVLGDVLEPPEPNGGPGPAKDELDDPDCLLSPDCLGTYESRELQTRYEIVKEEDQILARHNRHQDLVLGCPCADKLVGSAHYFAEVQFQRSKDGTVTGFHLSSGRVRNLRFDRITVATHSPLP